MTTVTLLTLFYQLAPISGITSSSDGTTLYASFQQQPGYDFYVSRDSGSTWGPLTIDITPLPFSGGRFSSVACNSTGSILYTTWVGGYFMKSSNSGLDWSNVNPNLGTTGEDGSNLEEVACDYSGTQLIASSNTHSYVYISTNSGATWTNTPVPSVPSSPILVAMNSDGTKKYATIGSNIYKYPDFNTPINGANLGTWSSITCNSAGNKVFATLSGVGVFIFSPTSEPQVISSTDTFQFISSYSGGLGLVTNIGTSLNTYSVNFNITCFREDTKILCFEKDREIYLPIQDLRKGTLVKTLNNGYVPINMIGKTEMYNTENDERIKDRLYICTKEFYPELVEDLFITGCHSILVDEITDLEREKTTEILGQIMITDNKYRLMACVDEKAKPYMQSGEFTIYHIALDHEDYYMNYGIYANGLLVETCSQRYLKEISKMKILD